MKASSPEDSLNIKLSIETKTLKQKVSIKADVPHKSISHQAEAPSSCPYPRISPYLGCALSCSSLPDDLRKGAAALLISSTSPPLGTS